MDVGRKIVRREIKYNHTFNFMGEQYFIANWHCINFIENPDGSAFCITSSNRNILSGPKINFRYGS